MTGDEVAVFQCWANGIIKTGTEQQQVDQLIEVLTSLLSTPHAQQLVSYENYVHRLKVPGFGILDLTNTVIALSSDLLHHKAREKP